MTRFLLQTIWIVIVATLTIAFWELTWESITPVEQSIVVGQCADKIASKTGKIIDHANGHAVMQNFIWTTAEPANYDVSTKVVWVDGSSSLGFCIGPSPQFDIVEESPIF